MTLRCRALVVCCLLLALPQAAGAQRVQAVDIARSEIRFAGKQMGVPAEGRFGKFMADLDFDPAALGSSRALIEVDLNSIDTGLAEADTEVRRSRLWFNVAVFPSARFESTSIRSLGGLRYEASGKLSIKGKARDIVAPFTVRKEGSNTVFEGGFTLLRLQFGVGEGPWADTETVANEVQVRFKLVGVDKK
jgi:polyisoprenoid-binding protein YceI